MVFSDTDEPDAIPSTSLSTLAKQLKEKKKKLLSAMATASAIEKTDINWTRNGFVPGNIEWEGQFYNGNEKHSPLDILMKYFRSKLFEKFATESNIYCSGFQPFCWSETTRKHSGDSRNP